MSLVRVRVCILRRCHKAQSPGVCHGHASVPGPGPAPWAGRAGQPAPWAAVPHPWAGGRAGQGHGCQRRAGPHAS